MAPLRSGYTIWECFYTETINIHIIEIIIYTLTLTVFSDIIQYVQNCH
jgi:hypothetical protein